MVDKQVVDNWINKADEDMVFAKAILEDNLEFYLQICFSLHQATEKYLKAYIMAMGLEFEKIHDLTKLLQICAQKDAGFNNFSDAAKLLNPFYIGTRYPDLEVRVSKSQTENVLKLAEQIAAFVKEKIEAVEGEVVEEDPSAHSNDSGQASSPQQDSGQAGQGKKEE